MASRLSSRFQDHPASVGETYGEHFRVATSCAWGLLRAAIACFVHAIAPWLFVDTASTTIGDLHRKLRDRGTGKTPVSSTSSPDRRERPQEAIGG